MSDTDNFHCVYLLVSSNKRFANQTYIGYTRDPLRRLRQHNGELVAGAKRTSRKRPWRLVSVLYGCAGWAPRATTRANIEWRTC